MTRCDYCHQRPADGTLARRPVCRECIYPSRHCTTCGESYRPDDLTEAWDDRLGWVCDECWEGRAVRADWEAAHAR